MTHHATQFDLPPQLFTWLKEACKEAKEKSEKANSDLVGHISLANIKASLKLQRHLHCGFFPVQDFLASLFFKLPKPNVS